MDSLFTPEYKNLNELFGRDIVYKIPEYQRPYSWDCLGKSDKNNQVNVLWEDLYSYFESGRTNPYFFGSMVLVSKSSDQEYEVIDGQQRLTTLTILFVALKCFLNSSRNRAGESNTHEILQYIDDATKVIDDIVFNKQLFGALTEEKKVRIEKSNGFDYDKVLKLTMECADVSAIDYTEVTNEQKSVINRYFDNRKFLEARLQDKFLTDGLFTRDNVIHINKFIDFLKIRVGVIRILASNFDVAYQVFEILNNRGLPLSNKDLFRNLIIREFSTLKNSNPNRYLELDANEKWGALEELLSIENEFISRWVESRKASKQQYSAFNDLQELYKDNYSDSIQKCKIECFYDDIVEDLNNYNTILSASTPNKLLNSKLKVILNAGNTTYSINLLLSLFRHCKYYTDNESSTTKILQFVAEFEKYILFLLLGPSKRFASRPIYDAIKYLNNNQFDKAIEEFSLDSENIEDLKKIISGSIRENSSGKLLISKFFWVKDSQNDGDDVVDVVLKYDESTLEHIIPQNPDADSDWQEFTRVFRSDFTYKLGNMTLLTKKRNSSAKNYSFSRKKNEYAKSKFSITSDIAAHDSLTEQFFRNRHAEIVKTILLDLNLE